MPLSQRLIQHHETLLWRLRGEQTECRYSIFFLKQIITERTYIWYITSFQYNFSSLGSSLQVRRVYTIYYTASAISSLDSRQATLQGWSDFGQNILSVLQKGFSLKKLLELGLGIFVTFCSRVWANRHASSDRLTKATFSISILQRLYTQGLFVGSCWCWFGLAGAVFLEENIIGWLKPTNEHADSIILLLQ